MTDRRDHMPGDWDAIVDRTPEPAVSGPGVADTEPGDPPVLTLMASAWADLVGMLSVCTGALVAILVLGERPALPAFLWAAVLALAWWLFAGAVLVVVRQGTPGMLMAGVSFRDPVPPRRVGWVLAAAMLGVVTLGLSAVAGGSALRRAAASAIVDGTA